VIEPDGQVALPHGLGRINVKGMAVRQAGTAIRDRLSQTLATRTALPAVHVVKRGRAVFLEGKRPEADYRIRPGDQLLAGNLPGSMFTYPVDQDGTWLPPLGNEAKPINVKGMTLSEAQAALDAQPKNAELYVPIYLTIGGWREQADPELIDQLEAGDATRVLRIERELLELQNMVRQLQMKP